MPCNGCVNISSLRDALVNTVVKIVDDNKKQSEIHTNI